MRVIHYESPPEHWDNSVRALHTVILYIGLNFMNFRDYLAAAAVMLDISFQVALSFSGRKFFNRISQHGTRHLVVATF